MKKLLWVEFIGLWGTGKTTLINKLKKDLKKYNIEVDTAHDYFSLKKSFRFFFILPNLFMTFKTSICIAFILLPHFIYLKKIKCSIGKDLMRSFFRCYQARINFLLNRKKDCFLWEGEFHLIPFLKLNLEQKESLVNLLLNITKTNYIKFVYLDLPFNKTIENIILDQKTKKNIRFSIDQLKLFKEYQSDAIKHQKELIDILKSKGITIYNFENYKKLISEILNH